MSENVDWNPLGQRTIRKCSVYSPMCWNSSLVLNDSLTCVSKYGGLIATVSDDSQSSRSNTRPDIHIYSAAGKEISSFRWNSGILLGIGWTHADELLCLQEDGQILLYNIFCQFIKSFTMGMECRENKVLEFEVFLSEQGTGLAVMNGLNHFFIINNIDEPKVRILADVPGLRSTPPSSWCVLPGSRSCRVLAANDNEIYLLDQGGLCTQQRPTAISSEPTSYISMAVSLDKKHIVLYTDKGMLWIGSSDFQEKYCEFNTNIGSRPKRLVWCCDCIPSSAQPKQQKQQQQDMAVVIYWPRILLVVGPNKDWVRYNVDDDIQRSDGRATAVLCADVDGVHVVTPSRHEFLQHVPRTVEGIFKSGSMAPGALLNDAAKEYDRQSEKADEYLRMLLDNGQLEEAVEQCILASTFEFQPRIQKLLLRAASFGKAFAPSTHLTELFVTTCQLLRVLNAVHDFNVGIALTASQLQHLTVECLTDRLVARRQFRLAYLICKRRGAGDERGASRILSHWACYKVQQAAVGDDEIAGAVRLKLKSARQVSYADIAERAVECGRKDLAIKLLEYEPRASEQVRLLSKLGRHALAVDKAVASGNTDLAYEAISRLRERSNLSDFLVAIRQQPVAYKLHLKHCREQNERMLKDLHEQEDNFVELAHCHIRDSYGTFRPEERTHSLHTALDNFSKARNEFGVKATEQQLQLSKEQSALELETEHNFVDTSLHDTLRSLLLSNHHRKAEQLRKQFKVSDKRWWWVKVYALAEQRNFDELETFSKSKKSPIGYLPFIEACIAHNAGHDQVAKYIPKVAQEKRVPALLKTGDVPAAAQLAIQTKNIADLEMVYKRCGPEHRDVQEQVRVIITQLQR